MTLNLKRKLLVIGAPIVMVGAGVTTMTASAATPTPSATPTQQADQSGTAAAAAEPADAAAEAAAAANEPALPGGGHADSATDANADHQFDGVELGFPSRDRAHRAPGLPCVTPRGTVAARHNGLYVLYE